MPKKVHPYPKLLYPKLTHETHPCTEANTPFRWQAHVQAIRQIQADLRSAPSNFQPDDVEDILEKLEDACYALQREATEWEREFPAARKFTRENIALRN